MRRPELDYILTTMLDSAKETGGVLSGKKDVSDFNFTVDKPLQVEQSGELNPVYTNPPIASLTLPGAASAITRNSVVAAQYSGTIRISRRAMKRAGLSLRPNRSVEA